MEEWYTGGRALAVAGARAGGAWAGAGGREAHRREGGAQAGGAQADGRRTGGREVHWRAGGAWVSASGGRSAGGRRTGGRGRTGASPGPGSGSGGASGWAWAGGLGLRLLAAVNRCNCPPGGRTPSGQRGNNSRRWRRILRKVNRGEGQWSCPLPKPSGVGEQGARFRFYADAGPGWAGSVSEIPGFGGRLGLIGDGQLIAKRKGVSFAEE
ncbi:hypothetical protein B0H14DRAFT_2556681 [Mycena olivaceomarginata]|nr:hypothetical protein B0H14DRAFT_2556681 [Mycena olivaceomarginata]